LLAEYELVVRPDYWQVDRAHLARYLQCQAGVCHWIERGAARGCWNRLDFDSQIYDLPMGRVDWIVAPELGDHTRVALLQELLCEADAAGVEQLSLRLSARDVQGVQWAEEAGFRVITAFVGLARYARAGVCPVDDIALRTATERDGAMLRAITDEAFTDGTRFHLDRRLAGGARELHRQWIDNCLSGAVADGVIVAEGNGEVVGYITYQINPHSAVELGQQRATIGLFAVCASARGRGVGRALLQAGLNDLSALGVERVEVGTESINSVAINAYVAAGFKVVQSCLTMHRWRA
jgi:ribosomal protein S18 acetylase RimI-like enzyme